MQKFVYKIICIVLSLFSLTSINAQELIPYRTGDKWGFSDTKGTVKIKCQYDKVSLFKDGFAYVDKEKKSGIIDSKGKEILSLDNWRSFGKIGNKKAFIVIDNLGHKGVINEHGDLVIPYGKYEDLRGFNESGITYANNGSLYGVVDYQGKEIIPLDKFHSLYEGNQKNDFFYIKKEDSCILLSDKGELLSDKKYNRIYGIRETNEYFITIKNNLFGIIDTKGNEVLPPMYDDIFYGNEDSFIVKKNDTWAFVTKNNKTITQNFDSLEPFNNGFAKVVKDKRFGLINKLGKLIINPGTYDDIIKVHENFIIVKKDGKLGVLNVEGKEITPTSYQKISDFNGGFAIITLDGKFGMIDTQGKIIKPCKYEKLNKVSDKALASSLFVKDSLYTPSSKVLIRFKQDGKYGLLNKKGKTLLKPEYANIELGYAHHNLLVKKQDSESNTSVYGYYNTDQEKFTTSITYKKAKAFKDKQFNGVFVQLPNNKKTILNPNGKALIPAELHYSDIKQINQHNLLIKTNTYSFGIYNISKKKFLIPLGKYGVLTPSKDTQFFCVGTKVKENHRIGTKYGIIDKNGKEITPVKYDGIEGEFNRNFVKNNIIEVKLDGKKGYIDTTGKEFFK